MKFSEKTWLKITLKVTKMQVCNLSLENIFLEKPQGVKLTPLPRPSVFRAKNKLCCKLQNQRKMFKTHKSDQGCQREPI